MQGFSGLLGSSPLPVDISNACMQQLVSVSDGNVGAKAKSETVLDDICLHSSIRG